MAAQAWAMWIMCWPSKSSPRGWFGRAHRGCPQFAGTNHIFLAGSETQRRKYIPLLAGGEWLAAWPSPNRFRLGRRQRANHRGEERRPLCIERKQDFHYQRPLCRRRGGDCRDRQSKGTHGLSAFVVEKGDQRIPVRQKENKLGLRASDTSELILKTAKFPRRTGSGVEGEGFIDAMRVLDGGRISIAALSPGHRRGALDAALKYVKERRQFGKAIADSKAFSGSSPTWQRSWMRRGC